MSYQEPFRLTEDEYDRDIDVQDAYLQQVAHYIFTMLGGEYTEEYIREQLNSMFGPEGELQHSYPTCKMWVRNPNTGDREEKYTTVDKLFRKVIEKDIIFAPSLTFYMPETAKRSKLSEFTADNVRKRGVIKGEMQDAYAAGNPVLGTNKKNEQNAVKTLNNGMSGAFSSPYTILFNQSAHSTLTSTCRTATSFGNAGNERLLGGRRHYDNASRVIDHFLSISTLTDFVEFKACMDKYGLHVPTVDETMEVIEYSAKDYWRSEENMAKIRHYVERTHDMARAAFVYMGDFFHLAKFNDEFMRGFIGALIAKDMACEEEITDWKAAEKSVDGDMKIIISQFRTDIVPKGKSFKDVKLINDETKVPLAWEEQGKYKELIRSALFLQKTIGEYSCLIKNVLTTKNLPINIARLPDVIRNVGVVSDTDSTMMTAQWWAQWFTGKHYGEEATRVSDAMIYIATQHLRHLMASMSVNLGVAKKRLFLYAMKNEYKFDSFALTTKAKHYFSIITGQEGQLKKEPELEVKGVSLRTSNIPPIIMREFKKTIKQLCVQVAAGEKIKIVDLLEKVASIEHNVMDSIKAGNGDFLKTTNIKDRSAYTGDEKQYHYHRMYNTIFGPKYGMLPEPPYDCVKLPVNLQNKTAINDWLESIKDPIIKNGAKAWFEETNYRKYTTLVIPGYLIENFGLPEDLSAVADVRRSAFATVEPYYHALECLGVFMIDKNRTRLLSDYYGASIEDVMEQLRAADDGEELWEDEEEEDDEDAIDED